MDPITAKRISDQLDALTTALHRVADGLEAVLHMLLDQAGVTVSLTEVDERNSEVEPSPLPENTTPAPLHPFTPAPKTDTRCISCLQLWTKEHRANCAIAPGRTVEFRDCKEVARVEP